MVPFLFRTSLACLTYESYLVHNSWCFVGQHRQKERKKAKSRGPLLGGDGDRVTGFTACPFCRLCLTVSTICERVICAGLTAASFSVNRLFLTRKISMGSRAMFTNLFYFYFIIFFKVGISSALVLLVRFSSGAKFIWVSLQRGKR